MPNNNMQFVASLITRTRIHTTHNIYMQNIPLPNRIILIIFGMQHIRAYVQLFYTIMSNCSASCSSCWWAIWLWLPKVTVFENVNSTKWILTTYGRIVLVDVCCRWHGNVWGFVVSVEVLFDCCLNNYWMANENSQCNYYSALSHIHIQNTAIIFAHRTLANFPN